MEYTNSEVKKKVTQAIFRKENMIGLQCVCMWLCIGHLHPILSQQYISRAATVAVIFLRPATVSTLDPVRLDLLWSC